MAYAIPLPHAAIFDLDGNLVDTSAILPILADKDDKNRFRKFYDATVTCPPVPWVVAMAQGLHARGVVVLASSGRPIDQTQRASFWAQEHGVPIDRFYLRTLGDWRPNHVVKASNLELIMREYEPILAVDDNRHAVAIYEQAGILTIKTDVRQTHGTVGSVLNAMVEAV